jgi:F-type H+-transporting ATPase subunit b
MADQMPAGPDEAETIAPPALEMPGAFGEAPVEGSELLTMADGQAHAEDSLLGLGAETWVYISVAIFFVLAIVIFKAPKLIADALDARISAVRRQLDEAKSLRNEAEALLADARAKAEAANRDAEAIVARARVEAQSIVAESEKAAAETIARRTAAAEAKIAAAERTAEAELRAELARRVTTAAASLIESKADKVMRDRLTEEAIAGLDRRLH